MNVLPFTSVQHCRCIQEQWIMLCLDQLQSLTGESTGDVHVNLISV